MKRTTALLLATLVGIGLLTVTAGTAAADAGTTDCVEPDGYCFERPHDGSADAPDESADVGVNNCNGPPPQFEDPVCDV